MWVLILINSTQYWPIFKLHACIRIVVVFLTIWHLSNTTYKFRPILYVKWNRPKPVSWHTNNYVHWCLTSSNFHVFLEIHAQGDVFLHRAWWSKDEHVFWIHNGKVFWKNGMKFHSFCQLRFPTVLINSMC